LRVWLDPDYQESFAPWSLYWSDDSILFDYTPKMSQVDKREKKERGKGRGRRRERERKEERGGEETERRAMWLDPYYQESFAPGLCTGLMLLSFLIILLRCLS
jgi:hypothetical protein